MNNLFVDQKQGFDQPIDWQGQARTSDMNLAYALYCQQQRLGGIVEDLVITGLR